MVSGMHDGVGTELSGPMRRVQARLGVADLREELIDRYHRRGQTMAQLAQACGISEGSMSRWFRQLGIEARFPGQRKPQ
jgi:transposase-like protein